MYTHMQHTHETCFLCRRSRPDKFVYYRDYAELEGRGRLPEACYQECFAVCVVKDRGDMGC